MLVSCSDTHLSTYFVHKFCKFSTSHVHFGLDKESRRLLPPLRWTISRYFVCIAYQENLNTIAEFECGWLNISTSSSQRTAPVRRFHLRAKGQCIRSTSSTISGKWQNIDMSGILSIIFAIHLSRTYLCDARKKKRSLETYFHYIFNEI